MKADQAKSACALANTDDPLEAIQKLSLCAYVGVTVWRGEDPIAAAGAVLTHPGNATTFLYATDRWPEVVIETTRFFRKTLFPALQAAGVRRVQSLSMAGDDRTNRWKERLFGGTQEAILSKYGKNGEDFVLYVRHLPVVTPVVN